jgi:hypothetical protein
LLESAQVDGDDAIDKQAEERGVTPNIPPEANELAFRRILSQPQRYRAHVLRPLRFQARAGGVTIATAQTSLPP